MARDDPPARIPADDPPVALAKHAIRLLEQRLAEDYGIRAIMGAEIEFAAFAASDRPGGQFGLPYKDSKAHDPRPSAAKPPKHRDAWFPESRRVAYAYHESATGRIAGHEQLELVLTHTPMRADGAALPHDALGLARSIEAARHHLKRLPLGYKPGAMSFAGMQNYARWKPMHRRMGDTIRFDAAVPGELFHNGLHLNCSFADAVTGQERLDHPHARDHLMNGIAAMAEENLYLLGSSYPAIERFERNFGRGANTRYHLCKARDEAEQSYIENRIPPADANSYYAVLLQLAAVHRTLAQGGLDVPAPEIVSHGFEQLTPVALRRRFLDGSQLGETLEGLETGLGTKFRAAIARHPPGTERSAQDKVHAQALQARGR